METEPRVGRSHGDAAPAGDASRRAKIVTVSWFAIRLLLALFLFVGALQLMKTGAADLSFLDPGGFLVKNAGSTFGLGWLGALFVLSGSPIAATSLALVAAGEQAAGAANSITEIQGFTMLTGSRLGAAFVVLVTAVVYAVRSGAGGRLKPVSTAVMALCTTVLIYVPAALLGFALLRWQPFADLELTFGGEFGTLLDVVYGGVLRRVQDLPAWIVFLGGLGVLLVAFKLIDTVLPDVNTGMDPRRQAWLRSKWKMFALGSLVALVTLSVSVALTVLVPLVTKGYAKREDLLPYIMGANITTLGDTLLAAFALNSPATVRIVIAQLVSTTLVSVVLLASFYPQVKSGVWRFQRSMVKSTPRLAAFTAALFLVPLSIVGIAGVAG